MPWHIRSPEKTKQLALQERALGRQFLVTFCCQKVIEKAYWLSMRLAVYGALRIRMGQIWLTRLWRRKQPKKWQNSPKRGKNGLKGA
jgi:hypothetical protein